MRRKCGVDMRFGHAAVRRGRLTADWAEENMESAFLPCCVWWGMMEMDGCGGTSWKINTTCFASSWFEREAEASDGNSARDAQGGAWNGPQKGAAWHLRRSAYRLCSD